MPRVLVVEDDLTQAKRFDLMLRRAGFQVRTAANGKDAMEMLNREPSDIVLTDMQMPELGGLELVEAVRASHPFIPVVLMTGYGSEETAVEALRKGAASYIPKRSLNRDIVAVLEQVLAVAGEQREQVELEAAMTRTEFHFCLDNDPDQIEPLVKYLLEPIARFGLCDRTGLIRIGMALREAVTNAVNHGNLEGDSEMRQVDETQYHELLAERRKTPPYGQRRVHIMARVTQDDAAFVIRDEGPGFDPAKIPDPTDPANLERIGGRGLLLIQTFMDEVMHNATGNQITLIKRREGARGDEQASAVGHQPAVVGGMRCLTV
jgi:CheY-like chemotaxis protein/anti-sigma regulatory factor (Ser/Thr protein kinase)